MQENEILFIYLFKDLFIHLKELQIGGERERG